MNHQPRVHRHSGLAEFRRIPLYTLITQLISGCSGIWNASDLALWVQDRAVEQGCERETIELDEWYTETADGNVWRGTCRDSRGKTQSFAIDVDPVWTPSKSSNNK